MNKLISDRKCSQMHADKKPTRRPGAQQASSLSPHLRSSAFICGLFFFFAVNSQAATVISGTLSITNHSALTNATSGQSYTLNTDTRTFTNAVANAATQIRVRTNDSAATILLSIAAQAGTYPFSSITSISTSAGTNITFRATNDTALTITLSPTNWGKVTYSTQTVGTVQTVVRVPLSAEDSSVRAGIVESLLQALNDYSTSRGLTNWNLVSGTLNSVGGSISNATSYANFQVVGGLGLHGAGAAKTASYTITTNDIYVGADTRSNTNLVLTLPSAAAASNLFFLIKDEGGAAATNTLKIYPQSGDKIDGTLTNLTVSNNFGGVILRSLGSTNYSIIASGGGVSGSLAGDGFGVSSLFVATNGNDSTGTRGDITKPFLTLGAAKTNGLAGDTIYVWPGLYTTTTNLNSKTGLNWYFFNNAVVSNLNASVPIFDTSLNPGNFNVDGWGEFKDNTNGSGGVLYSDSTSVIHFRFKRLWSDGCPVAVLSGEVHLDGDLIESEGNIGFQGALRITGATAKLLAASMTIQNNGGGSTSHAITFTGSANTNTVLRDVSLVAGGTSKTLTASGGAAVVEVEGTFSANLGFNNASINNTTPVYLSLAADNLIAPTNTAPFTIDATDFTLDTNYTNGTQRAWVGACFSLTATNSADALVALYLDQDADTTFEQTGIMAQLGGGSPTNYITTNIVQLGGWVQPGAVFIFTNLSVAPASAAINAGSSQWVKH